VERRILLRTGAASLPKQGSRADLPAAAQVSPPGYYMLNE
jgi:hypothetical protein